MPTLPHLITNSRRGDLVDRPSRNRQSSALLQHRIATGTHRWLHLTFWKHPHPSLQAREPRLVCSSWKRLSARCLTNGPRATPRWHSQRNQCLDSCVAPNATPAAPGALKGLSAPCNSVREACVSALNVSWAAWFA